MRVKSIGRRQDLPSAVARLEELLIRRALACSAGNRTEAAWSLNINRQLLYAKLKRYGLALPEDTEAPEGEDADGRVWTREPALPRLSDAHANRLRNGTRRRDWQPRPRSYPDRAAKFPYVEAPG
jgi:Bacterial regulatory protein, Fis family